MGQDSTIYFKAKPDFSSMGFEDSLPAGFTVAHLPDYLSDDYPEATHEIETGARFYGEGYERGPWPHIAAVLMILLASERVWFGSDSRDNVPELKPEDVIKISAHYMANGHRPYRKGY